jgi:kumamolisin
MTANPKLHSYIRRHIAPKSVYNGRQLRDFYQFPSALGAGVKVAVIELGGGFAQSDLDKYFGGLGISPLPHAVQVVSIDGATNSPGDPDVDGETYLDLCVIGTMAPACLMSVYFAENTEASFAKAIAQATADGHLAISISWGAAERDWTLAGLNQMQNALGVAAAAGVIVTAAAGDSASSDGDPGSNVDFPASSPYVLACGGTTLPSLNASVETAWSYTGGGVSAKFPRPTWQTTNRTNRCVPDVAGSADPEYGWEIIVYGTAESVGGTSAVAPMWAALVACLSSSGIKISQFMTALYANPSACRDITTGSNGGFAAATGYDCVTGLGVPIGTALASILALPAPSPPAPNPPAPTPPAPTPPAPKPTQGHTIVIQGATSVVIDGKRIDLTPGAQGAASTVSFPVPNPNNAAVTPVARPTRNVTAYVESSNRRGAPVAPQPNPPRRQPPQPVIPTNRRR